MGSVVIPVLLINTSHLWDLWPLCYDALVASNIWDFCLFCYVYLLLLQLCQILLPQLVVFAIGPWSSLLNKTYGRSAMYDCDCLSWLPLLYETFVASAGCLHYKELLLLQLIASNTWDLVASILRWSHGADYPSKPIFSINTGNTSRYYLALCWRKTSHYAGRCRSRTVLEYISLYHAGRRRFVLCW